MSFGVDHLLIGMAKRNGITAWLDMVLAFQVLYFMMGIVSISTEIIATEGSERFLFERESHLEVSITCSAWQANAGTVELDLATAEHLLRLFFVRRHTYKVLWVTQILDSRGFKELEP